MTDSLNNREPKFSIRRTKEDGPEAIIQKAIENKLTLLSWFVKRLHGSVFQFGMPDIFAAHRSYGIRLIEVKNPFNYSFTNAQLETFPKLYAAGVGVWILCSAEDSEINKLFGPCNWFHFLDKGLIKKLYNS